jgi:hypothetical protein
MNLHCPPAIRPDPAGLRKTLAALGVAMLATTAAPAAPDDAGSPAPLAATSLAAPNAAPLRAVRVFRVYGWHALEAPAAVIWLGVDEPYLIRVSPACRDAGNGAPSALALQGVHLVPGRDRLLFPGGPCVIDSLLRADRNKLRAGAIEPGDANAVRLIQEVHQEVPPRKSR